MGIRWILRRLQDRVRAHVSPSPGFRSLAAEFCPGCGAFADATTRLVVRAAGRISGAFGGAIPESRSTADDFVLVHQQFVRSTDRCRFDTLPRRRTDSLQKPSQRGDFLPLRSVRRPASVLVPRRRVRGMESLGPRQLRAADPDTTIFKCSCGTNSRAVSSNVGDDRNFGPPDGPTFALLGSMRSLCWPVAGQLRCPV